MKTIKLSRDKVTLVDDEDYKWLKDMKWHAIPYGGKYYAAHSINLGDGHFCSIKMHRYMMALGHGEKACVDHIDGDGLNNQRSNLRICTLEQNSWNQRKGSRKKSSSYKGVTFRKDVGKFRARIRYQTKLISLGHFATEQEAGLAYNEAARKLFKEYACLNQ